jgi:DedD protein
MDAALKQRLIGATVLVALAVIFLPMLVQGPEPAQSEAETVSLDAPPKPTSDTEGRPLETREILLPLPNGATPSPASATPTLSEDPNAVATVDTTVAPRIDAVSGEALTPVGTATPQSTASDTTGSGASAAAAASTESQSTALKTAPAVMPVAPSSQPAAPAATVAAPAPQPALTTTEAPLPATTASGNFAVNVGSYANVANADALLAKLKAAGLDAYAESMSLDGKAVRRIRLGPYAQRAEAERARAAALRLQADLPTSVVSLDAVTPRTEPVRPTLTRGFAVQVGAFRAESDANTLVGRLRGAGFTAFAERVNADTGQLWRVRVGPELDRAAAERRRGELKSKMSLDGMIVSHP